MKLNYHSIKYRKNFSKIILTSLIVLQISTGYSLAANISPTVREEQNQRLIQENFQKEARQKQKDVFMQEKNRGVSSFPCLKKTLPSISNKSN